MPRYFGGTLLGTGGLVQAYSDAVRVVIDVLPRTERVERRTLLLSIPGTQYELAKRLVAAQYGSVLQEEFAADVTLRLLFAVGDLSAFTSALNDLTAGQSTLIEV